MAVKNNAAILPRDAGELRQMLAKAAELGAIEAMRRNGIINMEVSKAKAYRRMSKHKIDEAIKSGKLPYTVRNNRVYIKVTDLESFAAEDDLYSKCSFKTA